MVGFHVYIDESGDEGFVFRDLSQGSSRWFVLSAIVTRADTDLETVKLVDEVRTQLKKKPKTPLHFRDLKHDHRLPYLNAIAKARLRTVSVLIHKPSIQEPEKFQSEKHLLYRYATRYLLERVSWLCRDFRRDPQASAKVVFSNRSSMSYSELTGYLDLLKAKTNDLDVTIDWSVIQTQQITARTHDSLMGLQIADAVASSWFFGVESSQFGFTEPRYAQMLKPVVYQHHGEYFGYGIKFWPRDGKASTEGSPELTWLNESFGRKKQK